MYANNASVKRDLNCNLNLLSSNSQICLQSKEIPNMETVTILCFIHNYSQDPYFTIFNSSDLKNKQKNLHATIHISWPVILGSV